MSRIFDGYDRTAAERRSGVFQNDAEPFNDVLDARVTQPKHDDAGMCNPEEGDDLAEVEVEREYGPLFSRRLLEDVLVRQTLQALFAQMDDVVPTRPQPLHDSRADARIGQEAQRPTPASLRALLRSSARRRIAVPAGCRRVPDRGGS